ncbi:hypothetical protein [Mucilaginibacter sp. NFX135]|uniref:hypothetical protein n=1 Tax=Mucilaginibacter sp. NFX135 TaxID=3402687 RepID=UPI003AFB26DD
MIHQDKRLPDNDKPNGNKANAYRVDENNLTEDDLQRGFLTSKEDMKKQDAPGMESRGMGGQNFGENNVTPSGDDEANPSQNAGYTNEYFRRTQPAEEHPENSNFTDPDQVGQPNYSQAINAAETNQSDKRQENNTDKQTQSPSPHPQQPYQEGTADNDGNNDKKHENISGPNETPDQQKVGE